MDDKYDVVCESYISACDVMKAKSRTFNCANISADHKILFFLYLLKKQTPNKNYGRVLHRNYTRKSTV